MLLKIENIDILFITKNANIKIQNERVPKGCVTEANWMSDVHPACNIVEEVDMNDFFL
jgi:hypothetical protein